MNYVPLNSRLQEREEVEYPWHQEYVLVRMKGNHDLLHSILRGQDRQQQWKPEQEEGTFYGIPLETIVVIFKNKCIKIS